MATQENRSGVGAFIGFIGFSTLAGLLVTVGVTPAIAVLGVTTTSTIDVFDSLPEYIEIGDLPQRNEVLAYQGGQPVHLATVYDQNREELQLDEISEHLRYAAVDGEDKRFWDHGGVDASSVVRAAVGSLASGGLGGSGGASTLTMQLVRNIKMQQALELPTQEEVDAAYREAIEPSASRKLAEMKLAIGLEKQYSKKEILAAYLNIAYFGDQTYGVQAAAQRYFGKDATNLTPAEAASILAIVQWPEKRNLSDPSHYPANTERRDVILGSMHAQGHLTRAQYDEAIAAQPDQYVHLTAPSQGCVAAAGVGSQFFCDYAVRVVKTMTQLGATQEQRDAAWRNGGYTIQTSLDLDLNGQQKGLLDTYDPNTEARIALGSTLDTVEASTGRVLTMAQNRNYNQLPSCAAVDSDQGACAPATDTSINYSVDQDLGGGIGFQPGSTYKLFTLLAWLEAGRSVNAVVNGTPHTTSRWTQCGETITAAWSPKNDSPGQRGNYTVAAATAGSVNAAYASMAAKLDLCDIRDVAAKLGVHLAAGGDLPANPASILGTSNIAPLTMASAYAAVANGGVYCAPTVIDAITDRSGKSLGGQQRSCTQALSPAVADTAFRTMQGTVARGTAVGAQTPDGTPLFAKTGTTDDADQIWLVGGSKQAVTAYWQGLTDGKKTNLRHYGSGAGGTYASMRSNVWKQAQTAVNQAMRAAAG
ncbi:Membrane carboxypeptidase (penicillin-binding protein) [Curtobacterium sp. 9128]|uniref:transglycosylase domain-containing protein n=1 Tax=Curtobacterium sp. 9128 TaxID=1793722 RepID=UPI0007D71F28|nr:transglycosylase domain-containing protein [Curtobacterium sp. 9128]SBN63514.1 Membrane carboxypeptidase (penicillin-binding protein) [Curtobacterium sp. 9128]